METLDLTPKWSEILPALLAVSQDGTIHGKNAAAHEMRRMAQAADKWNDCAADMVRTLEFILSDLNLDLSAETAGIIQSAIDKARGKA